MQGLCSNSALIWAPKTAGLRQALVIFYPSFGTPKNARVMSHLCPRLGPQQGRVEAADCEFARVLGTPENTGVL